MIFHRVIPGFMDQRGDPTGTGTAARATSSPNETARAKARPQYPLGSVAMANSGRQHQREPVLHRHRRPKVSARRPTTSLFGTVTSGMNVVDKINADGSSTDANGVPPKVDPPHR